MKKTLSCLPVLVAILLFLPAAGNAKAPMRMIDQYIDVYSGQANYQDKEVTATIPAFFFVAEETASRTVSFSNSNVFGGRWGCWFRDYPRYGLAVDLSFLDISGQDVEISAMPLSLMMFYRHPWLTSEEYTNGRIQPYIGLGLSLISANISADFTPDISRKVDGSASGTGIDFRAGIRLHVSKKFGIFAELRHLDGSIRIVDEPLVFFEDEASTSISSRQILVGISVKL